jgi:predicted RND superfamily exporter protein
MSEILNRWIAWRWPLLMLAGVLAVVCWRPAQQLVFDQSIETMFAPNNPLLPEWREFKELFGEHEVLLAAYEEPDGLRPENFATLQKLTRELQAAVPGMSVQSLATMPLAEQILVGNQELAKKLRELLTGYLISADHRTVAVVCLLPSSAGKHPAEVSAERAKAVDAVRGIIQHYPRGTLAGEPAMLVDGFRFLEQDGRMLEWLSTALVMLSLLLTFLSPRWVVIPLLTVQLAILMTRAVLWLGGFHLTMVSSMLSAMTTIVGVATISHIIVRYEEELDAGVPPREALKNTWLDLWWPIVGAIATDVLGFGALTLAHVGPVRDFGLMASLGSMLVLPCCLLIMPSITLLGAKPRKPVTERPRLARALLALWQAIERHPRRWLAGIVVVSVISVWYSTGLRIESDFTKNFREDSQLAQSYTFVESRLGGAGVWDLLVPIEGEVTLADLEKLRALERDLRAIMITNEAGQVEPGVTKALSLVDVLDSVSPFDLAADGGNFLAKQALGGALQLLRNQMPELAGSLEATAPAHAGKPPKRWLRVMLRSKERMPSETKALVIDQVRRAASKHFPPAEQTPAPKTTGFYVLLASLIESLLDDQWVTFAAATIGIGLLIGITLRSIKFMIIALIPNVLSNLLVLAGLGILGLPVNMGTVLIAAVSMGLSVDSSIHFLVVYRRRRNRGENVSQAIAAVEQEAGSAMVWATLALVVGFSSLAASEFVPTIYFGVLSVATMIGGMLGNLIVLPLLVYLSEQWTAPPEPGR